MSFGERLQEVRRDNGMTQEDFAGQLKVSRQAVSKWESSRGYPEIEKIIYICNRYGVTMDTLFAEEVPLGRRAGAAAAPEAVESRTLKTALDGFYSNLSPSNKWIGIGSLAAVALLIPLCMKYMKGGTDNVMTMLWVAAIVLFGVVEAATAGLVSIWFVAGALGALLAAMGGLGVTAQVVVFIAVSAAALAVTRPLVKKFAAGKAVPTNLDRVIGETCKVVEVIDNANSTGAVYVDGKTWTARSADGTVLPAGARVEIERMEGVKLFVKKYEEKAEVVL
ncbi:MAG: NfeD family protein [Oscillospiraceae bacterium]|nr:NfeD family protein [Oscillospiraceae bacterium]